MKLVAHRAVPRWLTDWCIRAGRGVKRLAAAAAVCATPAVAQDGTVEIRAELVPFERAVTAIEGTARGSIDGTGAYVFVGDESYLASPCPGKPYGWCVDATVPTPIEPPPTGGGLAEPLPDARVAFARLDGVNVRVWLAGPTDRYAHGVLGDAIEAGTLVCAVETRDVPRRSWTTGVSLRDGSVYEDIVPRLADLDGDGIIEVVTIRSDPRFGASLVVHALSWRRTTRRLEGTGLVVDALDGECPLIARTPPIGTPNRWLNPAAIHDFDGDGIDDVALVETPHIGGDVQLWSGASLLAGVPRLLASRRGFSNHAIGSRALDLAEVVRIGERPVLVLPDAERDALVAVAHGAGKWTVLGRVDLPGRVGTNIAVVGRDLMLGLDDGRLVRIVLDGTEN